MSPQLTQAPARLDIRESTGHGFGQTPYVLHLDLSVGMTSITHTYNSRDIVTLTNAASAVVATLREHNHSGKVQVSKGQLRSNIVPYFIHGALEGENYAVEVAA